MRFEKLNFFGRPVQKYYVYNNLYFSSFIKTKQVHIILFSSTGLEFKCTACEYSLVVASGSSSTTIDIFLNGTELHWIQLIQGIWKFTETSMKVNLKVLSVNCVLVAVCLDFGLLHNRLWVRVILLIKTNFCHWI